MAGTPGDILRFLEALRNGGGGAIHHQTVATAFSNQIGDVPREDAGMRFGYLGAIAKTRRRPARPWARARSTGVAFTAINGLSIPSTGLPWCR